MTLTDIQGWDNLRNLLSELRGMTDSNAPLLRMINPATAQIDAVRQDFREGVPVELARAFSRKLTREEWRRLYKGLARADLMALGLEDARRLVGDPAVLVDMVRDTEEQLTALAPTLVPRYKAKAQALAQWMAMGAVTSDHLLRNAHAIAHLLGEKDAPAEVSSELVDTIDRLVSLYAFGKLDSETRNSMNDLMNSEAKGMETVTGFLDVVRRMEIERRDRDGQVNHRAQHNGWKGYAPAVLQDGDKRLSIPSAQRSCGALARADDLTGRVVPVQSWQRSVRPGTAFAETEPP